MSGEHPVLSPSHAPSLQYSTPTKVDEKMVAAGATTELPGSGYVDGGFCFNYENCSTLYVSTRSLSLVGALHAKVAGGKMRREWW